MFIKTLCAGLITLMTLGGCEGFAVTIEPTVHEPGEPEVTEPDEPIAQDPDASEPDARERDVTAPDGSEEPAGPVVDDPRTIEIDPQALINERAFVSFTVAGGRDRPEMLHYATVVWEQGWDAYIKQFVEPEIKRGFRRIIVLKACGMQPVPNAQEESWNVVGTRTKSNQPVRSRALTLSQLARHRPDLASTFVASWTRVGAQVDELLLYVGLPPQDATQEEIEAWVAPFMNIPNVSFGLDSLGAISSDSAGARLLTYLLSKGKRVYVEPVMPKDEWKHWPTDHENFAAAVIDQRYDIMLTQDRWPNAEDAADELVVLVQGRSGESVNERYLRIASYLRAEPPDRTSVAFGTRGMSEMQVKSLIDLGRR